jgi:hypothetical protein
MIREINRVVLGALVAGSLVVSVPDTMANPSDFGNNGKGDGFGNQTSQDKGQIKISSSANPSVYGQWVTFTATAHTDRNDRRTAAGKVTFKQGRTILATVSLNSSGQAKFSTRRLAATGSAFYPITVELTDSDSPRNNSSDTLMQKILPATLTVTANNQTKTCGTPNPGLTVAYAGFVNGETLGTSDVTGNPGLATPATINSATGNYPIVASTGTLKSANYKFVFVNGTLEVKTGGAAPAKNVSITVAQSQSDYGVKLTVSGGSGQTCVIEASTDLVHWTAINTNQTDSAGQFTVADPDAKNYPCRYYRGVALAQP